MEQRELMDMFRHPFGKTDNMIRKVLGRSFEKNFPRVVWRASGRWEAGAGEFFKNEESICFLNAAIIDHKGFKEALASGHLEGPDRAGINEDEGSFN